ncbi:MAG: plastocyanin/azurin family copper-binding protein [Ignavibacteria bacterium]
MKIKKQFMLQFLFTMLMISYASDSYSTIRDVSVSSFMFSPSTIAANTGDTIRWTRINGSHTTTCDGSVLTSRPAGAAAWSSPLNSTTPEFKYVVTVAGTYNYKCIPHGSSGMVGVINVSAPPVSLNLTSIFEGFWNGASMVSDTAKVYLHNSTAPFARIDSAKTILNTAGNGLLNFANASSGNYFIIVRHRNSLETWSSTAQGFTAGSTTIYNFTTAANKAFGNNLTFKLGKFTNYSGDVNQDGIIDGSDLSFIDNDANNFVSGYVSTDVNGDTIVDGSDASIAENNASNFVTVARP